MKAISYIGTGMLLFALGLFIGAAGSRLDQSNPAIPIISFIIIFSSPLLFVGGGVVAELKKEDSYLFNNIRWFRIFTGMMFLVGVLFLMWGLIVLILQNIILMAFVFYGAFYFFFIGSLLILARKHYLNNKLEKKQIS